ncbi:MAG: hypothetical protein ACLFPX_01325 [Candidatus Omnitrophota bacterium]
MMKERHISFIITDDEKKMLEEVVVFEPFLQDNLEKIMRVGDDQYIEFDAYDLFDAISALKCAQSYGDQYCEKMMLSGFISKLTDLLNLVNDPEQKLGT